MSFPKLNHPTFTTTIPSTGTEITYRPFLVREEKVLMIASASKDAKMIKNAVLDILKSCIVAPNVDVKQLATFDIEYLFLKLRSKSVGENVRLSFSHPEGHNREGHECSHVTTVDVNIDEIECTRDNDHKREIVLSTNPLVGLVMRYPTLDTAVPYDKINDSDPADPKNIDVIFNIILDSIESIYTENDVFPVGPANRSDAKDFLEQLTQDQFTLINNFFTTMPRIEKTVNFTCAKCGERVEHKLQGLYDFFT